MGSAPTRICSVMVLGMVCTTGFVGGCQQSAEITWDSPEPVSQEQTALHVMPIKRLEQSSIWGAKPEGESIGKHTFTLFALPVGNINADSSTPVLPSYDKALGEALTAAGLRVTRSSWTSARSAGPMSAKTL